MALKDAVVLGMALNQVIPRLWLLTTWHSASLAEIQQSDAGPEDFGSDAVQPDSQDIHPAVHIFSEGLVYHAALPLPNPQGTRHALTAANCHPPKRPGALAS